VVTPPRGEVAASAENRLVRGDPVVDGLHGLVVLPDHLLAVVVRLDTTNRTEVLLYPHEKGWI
jgi:hypothetical protein